uniref:ADP-ribosyl cyclase/cyclic ADP-ribose hydrolase n=1 Tax=Neogobius melanostomus TaxID=47308 RepID=A0A8C6WUT9_9GOBI
MFKKQRTIFTSSHHCTARRAQKHTREGKRERGREYMTRPELTQVKVKERLQMRWILLAFNRVGSNDCAKIWSAFEQAYVSKDPCTVPPEAYNALLEAAPLHLPVLFWSKTKDLVHDFTDKSSCHVTLEDTLLGTVLDGVTWCGKEGSNETFTSVCPGWSDCDNNPVRSFWNKASASYAEVACGNVSVMLNGSILTPFSPVSIFASVEVKHFNPDVMNSLNVILVAQEKVSNCTNASLKDLQKQLAQGIAYSCQEVPE